MLRWGPARTTLRALVVVTAVLAGMLAMPEAAFANDPPVITGASVSPYSFTSSGGTVTVVADVTDDIGPVEVYVDITYGSAYYGTSALSRGGPTPDSWTIDIDLPANFSEDPASYLFTIRARDLDQEEATLDAGEVTVDGQPPFDEPPLVSDPSVTPTSLPSGGGAVALAVSAWDLRGISEAYVVVAPTGGTPVTIPLDPISDVRFTATYAAPANPTGTPILYAVTFHALDDIGQESTINGAGFTVTAAPPVAGKLQVRPAKLRFGAVKIGRHEQQSIVITNTGRRGTGPVTFTVKSAGAPFVVLGNGTVTLRPGQSKTIRVEFRPTTTGPVTGSVSIVRADGAQILPVVALAGRGVPRR